MSAKDPTPEEADAVEAAFGVWLRRHPEVGTYPLPVARLVAHTFARGWLLGNEAARPVEAVVAAPEAIPAVCSKCGHLAVVAGRCGVCATSPLTDPMEARP
jgi:hypothetical protein